MASRARSTSRKNLLALQHACFVPSMLESHGWFYQAMAIDSQMSHVELIHDCGSAFVLHSLTRDIGYRTV
jgi:hypothetical protein